MELGVDVLLHHIPDDVIWELHCTFNTPRVDDFVQLCSLCMLCEMKAKFKFMQSLVDLMIKVVYLGGTFVECRVGFAFLQLQSSKARSWRAGLGWQQFHRVRQPARKCCHPRLDREQGLKECSAPLQSSHGARY